MDRKCATVRCANKRTGRGDLDSHRPRPLREPTLSAIFSGGLAQKIARPVHESFTNSFALSFRSFSNY